MVANPQYIMPEEIDFLGFLHQNIMQKLEEESVRQGLTRTHPRVIQAVARYFNLGPSPHQTFDRLAWRIAHSQQVSSVVLLQVTPQNIQDRNQWSKLKSALHCNCSKLTVIAADFAGDGVRLIL